jgi:hypothetical protein
MKQRALTIEPRPSSGDVRDDQQQHESTSATKAQASGLQADSATVDASSAASIRMLTGGANTDLRSRRSSLTWELVLDLLSSIVFGVHLASIHIPAHEGQQNFNPGVYARMESGVTVGTYHNTLGKQTFYAGYTVERGPFALTPGLASGYQRSQYPAPCSKAQTAAGSTHCWYTTPGSKTYLMPMLAPSVRLPAVLGVTPRVSYIPGLGGSSNVFHLSIEAKF